MKKTITILCAVVGAYLSVAGASTVQETDFTAYSGSTLPEGWLSGQWQGNNTPHFLLSAEKGAYVNYGWKQNYLYTQVLLNSQTDAVITFTVWNNTANTGNMFYLSSEQYSIIIGNSYTDYANVYVGTDNAAVGSEFISFQNGKIQTTLAHSENLSVVGNLNYTLTLNAGQLDILVQNGESSWNYTLDNIPDADFTTLGFIVDAAAGAASVKNVEMTLTPLIPEPTSSSLGILALVTLLTRRRRSF